MRAAVVRLRVDIERGIAQLVEQLRDARLERETKLEPIVRAEHQMIGAAERMHQTLQGTLRALKLAPRGMGPPELVNMAEAVTAEGQYALTMRFFAPNTPYRVWKDRAPRFAKFFGPNVRAREADPDALFFSPMVVEISARRPA